METSGPEIEKPGHIKEQWRGVVLGVLPFLLTGLVILLMLAPVSGSAMQVLQHLGGIFFLGATWSSSTVCCGAGCWVYPYLVYGIFFAFFLSTSSTPGLVIFGTPLFGREAATHHE